MAHTCSDCGFNFNTLSALRVHDCPEQAATTVQIRARLITTESPKYDAAKMQQPGLHDEQGVFPMFDMAVSGTVPSQEIQQKIGDQMDSMFKEEHGLWDWAGQLSKEDVRKANPAGEDHTHYYDVGSIEINDEGDVLDTFVTLEELKSSIRDK